MSVALTSTQQPTAVEEEYFDPEQKARAERFGLIATAGARIPFDCRVGFLLQTNKNKDMSTFNTFAKESTTKLNRAGGEAFALTPELELYTTVVTA